MVDTAMSTKKVPKSALKGDSATSRTKATTRFASDSQTVASQVTTISQLMEIVSAVQQDHRTIMSRFDQLTEQIALLLMTQQSVPTSSPAGGHASESGRPK